jgi:hypothetical protein
MFSESGGVERDAGFLVVPNPSALSRAASPGEVLRIAEVEAGGSGCELRREEFEDAETGREADNVSVLLLNESCERSLDTSLKVNRSAGVGVDAVLASFWRWWTASADTGCWDWVAIAGVVVFCCCSR